AFADAGADCLYAPGIKTGEEIAAVVAVGKPVNFRMVNATNFSVNDLAAMGVRRISTGGTLARTAWNGFIRAAREMAEHGTFKSFDGTIPNSQLNAFFSSDRNKICSSSLRLI